MKDIVNDGFAKVVKPYMDAQNKKDRELIAPVEVSPAESAHSIGDQIIFNGILYNVTAQIAADDPLSTTGAGANISPANNIETQLKNQQTQIQSVAAQAAAQSKIAQEMLAPIEEDETDASRAYEIGDQLILDGVLYDVIDDIAQHGIITPEGAGANIEEAEDITTQIKNKTVTTDAVPTEGSANPVQSGGVYTALTNEKKTRGALGAKNLLPNRATSRTINGVTFTVNSDGSITVNGTATAVTFLNITKGDFSEKLPAGEYYLSRGEGTAPTGTALGLQVDNGSGQTYYPSSGKITFSEDKVYKVYFYVNNGVSLTDYVIKPMIRLATDTDPTYQPYTMTNKELTPIAQAVSNPNLLDNPWFTVNQRGLSQYTSGLSVDRWELRNTTQVDVINDGIKMTNKRSDGHTWLGQKFPFDEMQKLIGRTLTASVLTTDGKLFTWTFVLSNNNTSSPNITVEEGTTIHLRYEWNTSNNPWFILNLWIHEYEKYIDIKAMKLELGSVSTLAMDTAPNYATELLKCQRYFVRLKPSTDGYASFSGLGFVFSATGTRVPIDLPVPMRATPTISKSGAIGFIGITSAGITVLSSTDIQSVTLFDDVSHWHFMIGLVHATGVEPTIGTLGYIRAMNDASAYIDFSADL